MRFVPVNCIREGMVCGKALYGKGGELLLAKGFRLKPSLVDKIHEIGYNGLYVEDDLSRDIPAVEVINDNLKYKMVCGVRNAYMGLEMGGHPSPQTMKSLGDLIKTVVEDICDNKGLMVNMVDLKVFDDYTFFHSVNVTVLSVLAGFSLGLHESDLYELGMGALLHDIGKAFIPKAILNKNGTLTPEEFEVMKTHPAQGASYLERNFNLPAKTCMAVLQHHEKVDGSGYPASLSGRSIGLFAKIIGVADVYDALTSDRPYRRALPPFEAMEYVLGGGGSMFDRDVVSVFCRKIAPYPVGSCVRLSDGRLGIVLENYEETCLRPKIRIIKEDKSSTQPCELNLSTDRQALAVTIIGLVDI